MRNAIEIFELRNASSWVFSSLLPSSDQSGHNIYSSSNSPTYQAIDGATWSITYQDQSGASGIVGTDTVTVGGTTVTGQAVELANKVSSTFVSDSSDGLVGLAFSNINTGNIPFIEGVCQLTVTSHTKPTIYIL